MNVPKLAISFALLFLVACDKGNTEPSAVNAPAAVEKPAASVEKPTMLVYKSPTCGCCNKWIDHLRAEGFNVQSKDSSEMPAIKQRLGVPDKLSSCHTGETAGYFFEGHIPAEDVKRFLAEGSSAKGLTVPHMPVGSPGMEVASGATQPYDVLVVEADGDSKIYASH